MVTEPAYLDVMHQTLQCRIFLCVMLKDRKCDGIRYCIDLVNNYLSVFFHIFDTKGCSFLCTVFSRWWWVSRTIVGGCGGTRLICEEKSKLLNLDLCFATLTGRSLQCELHINNKG